MPQDLTYELSFNGLAWWLAVIIAGGLIAGSFFYYRQTTPPVSRRLRILLFTIRTLALTVLFLVLARPDLTLVYYLTPRPGVALLADASLSMSVTENGRSRMDRSLEVMQGITADPAVRKTLAVTPYVFSDTYHPFADTADTFKATGLSSNLGGTIEEFSTRIVKDNLKALVMITDGAANSGRDPELCARTVGIPVYTVGIGDTTPVRDLIIRGVLTNEIAYKNSAVPVKVSFSGNGFKGQKINLSLYEGKKVLERKNVRVVGEGQEQQVEFSLTPQETGTHRYTAAIPVRKDEKISRNNRYSFYIRVLKDKMNVLLISGGPGYDHAFLKRALEHDGNTTLKALVAKNDGGYYGGDLPGTSEEWDALDLVILRDVPAARISSAATGEIARLVEKKGKGLLVLTGDRTAGAPGPEATPLGKALPVAFTARNKKAVVRPFQPLTASDAVQHPVMALASDPEEALRLWEQVPPLQALVTGCTVRPGAMVLATHPTEKNGPDYAPLIVAGRYGTGKVLMITGYPLWQWRLFPAPVDQALAESFNTFCGNIVRWLATTEDTKRFRITTDRRVYRSGETVTVKAQLYDARLSPLDGAAIEAEIAGNDLVRKTSLEPAGEPGLYRAKVPGLPSGSYTVKGEAFLNSRSLGTDKARVYIDDYSMEFEDIRMRRDVLQRMADGSGGQYYSIDTWHELVNVLTGIRAERVRHRKQLELWTHPLLLALFILLLAVEWTIRKRKGML